MQNLITINLKIVLSIVLDGSGFSYIWKELKVMELKEIKS